MVCDHEVLGSKGSKSKRLGRGDVLAFDVQHAAEGQCAMNVSTRSEL